MPKRQLIIPGGPNGAGKSSAHAELERLGFVTVPFFNPDDFARNLGGAPDTRDGRASRETLRGREVLHGRQARGRRGDVAGTDGGPFRCRAFVAPRGVPGGARS